MSVLKLLSKIRQADRDKISRGRQRYVLCSGDSERQGINLVSAAYNPLTMVKLPHPWGLVFLYVEWASPIWLTRLLSAKDLLQCLAPPPPKKKPLKMC